MNTVTKTSLTLLNKNLKAWLMNTMQGVVLKKLPLIYP